MRAQHKSDYGAILSRNGASLDFHETDSEIASQHYAFLIGEDDFDQVFARIRDRGLEYCADPGQHRGSEINRDDAGERTVLRRP